MIASLAIHSYDAAEFAALPEEVRKDIRTWLKLLAPAFACGQGNRVAMLQRAATLGGVSFPTARGKFYAVKSRGWRALVNKSKVRAGRADENIPSEIIDKFREFCERNQRKSQPAWRAMIREWRAGHLADLPWPEINPRTDLPFGCSYENLIRYAPSKFELAAAREGRTAAAEFRPQVFRTRAGLQVGQFFLFDDIWHDHKVHVEGERQARRPLEFHALDLFSGCKFAWGIKAQMENLETGRMEHLKEREMRFLLAGILGGMTSIGQEGGFSPDGCTLVVEHGTAAISEEIEALLHDLSGGLIKIARSGIQGASAFAGQYAGRAKGNFKMKAALESLGNLIHNEMAYLAGQMGSNARLNGPEEIAGRDKHHDALCKAILALPPEQANLLRLPFMELNVFRQVAAAIYHRINSRTEHELEGWIEAGLVANEFRLAHDQPWMSCDRLLAMPLEHQRAISALIDSGPYLSQCRKMSPLEVFAASSKRLTRFTPAQVAILLGKDLGNERSVTKGLFEFEEKESGPGIYRFLARINGAQLPDGETFLTVLNPMDDQHLHVFDAKGRWLGQCDRWNSISHADVEALQRQCGRVAKIENELLYPVARRGAELTRRRIEDGKHNAAVLGGRAVTPKAKERAENLTAIAKGLSSEDIAAAINPMGTNGGDDAEAGFSLEEINDLFKPTDEPADSDGEPLI